MDKIQQIILDTYKKNPRQYTQILQRNKEVMDYINSVTDGLGFKLILEKLYYAVYRKPNICQYGNKQPLKSFKGHSFCGRAGICQCAKESVSKNISVTKQNYSGERKQEINNKRKETTYEIYGVTNNGQIYSAKEAHKEFYTIQKNIDDINTKVKLTKLQKHGNEKFNNRKKAEETCLEKYGVKNTWSLTEDKQNPNLDILRDKEKLSNIFPKYSVEEISDMYHLHVQTVYHYLNKHELRVPYKSTFEQEIVYYLNSIGITNILTNKRAIIGKELDIFLPDYNLAIEYNGVYWHHDKIPYITKTYHYDKFIECEKKGIELFSIFSDSWDSKKEIWKEKIKAKLQLSERKIYARKTSCKILTISETRDFLNKNHIQGYCVSQYAYGLEYNNEIIAIMTFSQNRVGIGSIGDSDTYELVRYATSCSVIGGASKLLNHFILDRTPKQIISYSDNQYSVGNLYKVLGFQLKSEGRVGYRYYNPSEKKMYHRYNFTKYKLIENGFDPNKTEKEIMDDRGFLRIWDCGSRTWILNL